MKGHNYEHEVVDCIRDCDGDPDLGRGDEMKEVKKLTREMFDKERLNRIQSLHRVIGKYSVLFSDGDRELITDALEVHAALIRIFEKEGGQR